MANPNPCFFQLYLEENNSRTMSVPPPFIKNFSCVPRKISLINLLGQRWPVKLRFVGSKLFITGGWESYAKAHLLKTGEFVVFQYLKDTEFLVTTFGIDGCIKPEPLDMNEVQISRGGGSGRGLVKKLSFHRIHSDKNFVCFPKTIIDEHGIKLPQEINLRYKDYCIKSLLQRTTDRAIIGYAGICNFWRMIGARYGDRLEFEVVLGDEENTIEEILVTNLSAPTGEILRRGVLE